MNIEHAARIDRLLETPRLRVAPIRAEHAALLYYGLRDPEVYRWISSTMPESVADLAASYERSRLRLQEEHDVTWFNWAVQRTDGAWIGKLDAEVDANMVATNVGYLFFSPFWGQGYATEAVRALSDHLAQEGIAEQRAVVTLGNEASYAVLVRAGFVRTCVLPSNDRIRGVLVDDVEFVRRPS